MWSLSEPKVWLHKLDILIDKRKEHTSPGEDASTAEAAPADSGETSQGWGKSSQYRTESWTSSRATASTAQNLV